MRPGRRRGKRGSAEGSGAEPSRILLGPQAEASDQVASVLADLEAAGARAPGTPVATITAGWQEREGEPELVRLGSADPARDGFDLGLYAAGEGLADADPELVSAHKESQGRLKLLRRVYNRRLAGLIDAYVDLGEMRGDGQVLKSELTAALAAIRALDARHLLRVAELRHMYEAAWRPGERDAVRRIHERISSDLDGVDTVVIAGGHIATLLNRLRLFGLRELLATRNVVAWSAGAMAIAETVVLFHDCPPWGAGNAEVFDRGLGLAVGLIPFPHATARLVLDDPFRTGRLARRFAPDACVLLDPGTRLDYAGGTWTSSTGAERLDRTGRRRRLRPAAA